jgi:hypothetical protein
MTEREEKELRNYCAWMLKEYGFDFPPTDPVIPALYVMHREMMANRKSNEAIATSLQGMAKNIKPTVYNFSQPGEAWKFQIAQGLKWFLVVCGFIVSAWGWYFVLDANGDIDAARSVLKHSTSLTKELLPLVQKDTEGFLYLEFDKPQSTQVANFTQYDQLPNGKVRVYLGNE